MQLQPQLSANQPADKRIVNNPQPAAQAGVSVCSGTADEPKYCQLAFNISNERRSAPSTTSAWRQQRLWPSPRQLRYLHHTSTLRRLRLPLPSVTPPTNQQLHCRLRLHLTGLLSLDNCGARDKSMDSIGKPVWGRCRHPSSGAGGWLLRLAFGTTGWPRTRQSRRRRCGSGYSHRRKRFRCRFVT